MNTLGRKEGTKRGRTRPLTPEQTRLLLHEAKAEGATNHLFLTLCYTFGMRVSECVSLRRQDVDLRTRRLTVVGLKGGNTTPHAVPDAVWKPLMAHMRRLDPGEEYLFPARNCVSIEPHMSAQAGKMLFKRVAARAGLDPRLGIHSLRSTLGHRLAEAGMNVQHIAGALRHADPRSSLQYTSSVVDAALESAVDRIVRRAL